MRTPKHLNPENSTIESFQLASAGPISPEVSSITIEQKIRKLLTGAAHKDLLSYLKSQAELISVMADSDRKRIGNLILDNLSYEDFSRRNDLHLDLVGISMVLAQIPFEATNRWGNVYLAYRTLRDHADYRITFSRWIKS